MRPIGVAEVVRRETWKAAMSIVKADVTKTVGNLQLCGGQDTRCEVAVYSMHDIFATNETEAVLLVDAEKLFISINRQALLHNIQHVSPPKVTFVHNCFNVLARLFVIEIKELYVMKTLTGRTNCDSSLWNNSKIIFETSS